MFRLLRILVIAVAASLPIVPASAQDGALTAAKAAGLVGERPDGLVGAVTPRPTAEIRALVDRINAERMRIYQQAAQRNGATLEDTRRIFRERMVGETPSGQFYMNDSSR